MCRKYWASDTPRFSITDLNERIACFHPPDEAAIFVPQTKENSYHFCMKIALNSLRAQTLLFGGTKMGAVTSGENQELTEPARMRRFQYILHMRKSYSCARRHERVLLGFLNLLL